MWLRGQKIPSALATSSRDTEEDWAIVNKHCERFSRVTLFVLLLDELLSMLLASRGGGGGGGETILLLHH